MIVAGIIFCKEIIVLLFYGLFLECNAILLNQPLTNNQLRNTKFQLKFFGIVTIRKEKRQPCLISFIIVTVTKNVG